MKKLLLLLSILFTNLFLVAQDGYTLNFETKNLQGKTIEISHYYGSSRFFYSKAIVPISENQQIVKIKDTTKILGGIYKLNFIGQKESRDIIIDNGDSISFSLNGISLKNFKPLNSEKNKLFFMYPSLKSDSIIKTYLANHRYSIGAEFFKLEKVKREIPVFHSKRAEYQKTFWDNIDLNNKRLQYLPNIYHSLTIYNELREINDSLYSNSMNSLLNKVKSNSSNFEFFLTWYFKNMSYNEKYFLDKTYVNTYKKYFDTIKLDFDNISNFRAIQRTYDDVNANLKGEVISDFKFLTPEDSSITLSKIYPENEFTFIAFFDPYCFHCQKAMPKISALFTELKKDKKIATVGMLNAYGNEGWEDFILNNSMEDWINLYSKDENKAYQEKFNSYSNPRFFLIDNKGVLLSRSGDVKEILRIIIQN